MSSHPKANAKHSSAAGSAGPFPREGGRGAGAADKGSGLGNFDQGFAVDPTRKEAKTQGASVRPTRKPKSLIRWSEVNV